MATRRPDAVDIATLRELLSYNEDTGEMVWKERLPRHFTGSTQAPEHSCRIWNSANAGRPALCSVNGNGYLHGAIFGRTISAHKAAWAVFHGEWPQQGIDHINGVRTDNAICNLRDVPDCVNAKNQKRSSRNTSGVTGVHLDHKTGKWVASIKGGGKVRNLGYFASMADAVRARKFAEVKYGFHPNHGRIAA